MLTTKELQKMGTIAAAKKAHDKAEADYKRAFSQVEKLLRDAEKSLRMASRSLSVREDLEIYDTFNADTRSLRKATNALKAIIYDGRRKESKEQIRSWATSHNQIVKPNNTAITLSEVKKTAEKLDKEEKKTNEIISKEVTPRIKELMERDNIFYDAEKKLNSYVSNKALKTLRSKTRTTKKSVNERLEIMGGNAKTAWAAVDDDTPTGNSKYGRSTVVNGIKQLTSLSDLQLGSGLYILIKSGIISDIELKKIFASNQKKLLFDVATYNLLIHYFMINKKYYVFTKDMEEQEDE